MEIKTNSEEVEFCVYHEEVYIPGFFDMTKDPYMAAAGKAVVKLRQEKFAKKSFISRKWYELCNLI